MTQMDVAPTRETGVRKVSVLGAGAIGSMLGGLIRHHDPSIECVMIGRGEHGEAMADQSLVRLDGSWGVHEVPIVASTDMSSAAQSDLILVTVKSQATPEAIESMAPYLGDAIVVSVQNGFNDEVLLRHVAPEKLVMGITATNVSVPTPGTASLKFPGTIVLGPNPTRSNAASVETAIATLAKTKFLVFGNDNIDGVRYNKLAINSPGYAASLSRTNFIVDGVCHPRWRRSVGARLAQECVDVFDAAGVRLESIPKLPDIRKLRKFFGMLDWPLIGHVVAIGAKRIFNRRPIQFSLEQDLAKGKPTEVDFTNGEITRLAQRHGVDAPMNQLVIDMAHEAQSGGAGEFFTRDEVIDRFEQVA